MKNMAPSLLIPNLRVRGVGATTLGNYSYGESRADGEDACHFYAKLWKPYLIEFMASLDPPQRAAAE